MNRYAILVGIDKYDELGKLQFAEEDAKAFAESLKRNYGFQSDEITLMTTDTPENALKPQNRAKIRKQLNGVREMLLQREETLDLLVFGYWGHGVWKPDENGVSRRFLCPADLCEEDFFDTALPLEDVRNRLADIPARDTWLVLDCCQNEMGGARGAGDALTAEEEKSFQNLARDICFRRKKTFEARPDRQRLEGTTIVFNSCSKNQKAYEWPEQRHGLFTYYLLEAMNKRYSGVTEIFEQTRRQVPANPRRFPQTPLATSEGGLNIALEPVRSEAIQFGDVFISYRHVNAELVLPIEDELRRRGISYFIDREGIDYGGRYAEIIMQAINRCRVLLVVWTQEANDSRDIKAEVANALNLDKMVLPYCVGNYFSPTSGLAYYLTPVSRYEVPVSTLETVRELGGKVAKVLGIREEETPVKPAEPKKPAKPKKLAKPSPEKPVLSQIVVPDDVPTLAEAYEKIPENGTIFVRPGTHRVPKTITITKNVKIIGDENHPESVILQGGKETTLHIQSGFAEIAGMTIRNKGKITIFFTASIPFAASVQFSAPMGILRNCVLISRFGAGFAVNTKNSNPTITHCTARDCGETGFYICFGATGTFRNCTTSGISVAGMVVRDAGTNPTVEGCTFDKNQCGILVYKGAAGTFRNCTASGNTKSGMEILNKRTNPTVEGCRIERNQLGGVYVHDFASGTFRNNQLSGNEWQGKIVNWYIAGDSNATRENNVPNK